MKPNRATWACANLLILFLTIAGGWWGFTHRQDILDWWRLRSYVAPAEIAAVASDTSMTQRGRDLLYVSDPKIENREAFNQACHTTNEQGKVLGCYSNQTIFLFNITDPRLAGAKQVTAAHEMLHAAYERLDDDTKMRVDTMVRAQADALKNDQKLQDLIALYDKTEPGQSNNELHSILATEYASLSPELEAYYKTYFTDRAKVIGYEKSYNAEFVASTARIAAYQAEIARLKKQIEANTATLEIRNTEINNETARLEALRRTDPATYNSQVPAFNAKVQAYNQLARSTQALITQHNAIVAKVKTEAALQADLTNSLDSRYQPAATQ